MVFWLRASKQVRAGWIRLHLSALGWVAVSLALFSSLFSLFVIIPQWETLRTLALVGVSLPSRIGTVFTYYPLVDYVMIAILSLLGSALLLAWRFAWKHNKATLRKAGAAGVLGSLAALVGFGCAGCGVALLGPVLVVVFGAQTVALFDQYGVVVWVVSLSSLVFSLLWVLYRLGAPQTCDIT